jgi:hypothetical protein
VRRADDHQYVAVISSKRYVMSTWAARVARRPRSRTDPAVLNAALPAAFVVALAGCVDDFTHCPPVEPRLLAAAPAALSQTGLYDDIANDIVAADVVPFAPQFELWSDGAEKRRWIRLPPNERIDTSDPDAWQFPVGTQVWKEFVRDGVRVETRLLARVGSAPDDWLAAAYLWAEDGREAWLAADGAVDALGTPHDVPAASDCMGCHRGTSSRVLGFSAVQLSPAGPGSAIDLEGLIARGLVTSPPPDPIAVPGDETTRPALGWLHANCGHCHNQHRPSPLADRCYDPERDFDLSLRADGLDRVEATGVYRTAIGDVIEPGDPTHSRLVRRVKRGRMPPLAVETVDEEGIAAVEEWIRGL